MKLREQKGFTLIEVIVVAGIIAVLAGILVPLIFKEIDESKITRASADVRSISSAMIVLRKDTGQWPVSATCSSDQTMHRSEGSLPTIPASWDASVASRFDQIFSSDAFNCWPNTWKGPYMAHATPDPWGNSYMMNSKDFPSTTNPPAPIWIISGGPNGVVDTEATATEISGTDDIGARIR